MDQMSYQRYREVYGPPECQRPDCGSESTMESGYTHCEGHE